MTSLLVSDTPGGLIVDFHLLLMILTKFAQARPNLSRTEEPTKMISLPANEPFLEKTLSNLQPSKTTLLMGTPRVTTCWPARDPIRLLLLQRKSQGLSLLSQL